MRRGNFLAPKALYYLSRAQEEVNETAVEITNLREVGQGVQQAQVMMKARMGSC